MSLTVVGSVALDTVETPWGANTEGLGGAAVYFALAARHFCPVHLVGVIGDDFPEEHIQLLAERGINLDGLEKTAGRTFRWTGRYHQDVNERDTLDTQLNVFADFHPKVPERARAARYLFLGNIHPALQLEVLGQTQHSFAGLDTMNLWIQTTPDELKEVLKRVNVLIINDSEARMLTGEINLRDAAAAIRAMGPEIVVIKKGEHGCMLFAGSDSIFAVPAIPLPNVIDPTGAGDSFAGGFMGYISHRDATDFQTLKQAVVYGTIVASFTCQAFGPNRLAEIEAAHIDARYEDFKALTQF